MILGGHRPARLVDRVAALQTPVATAPPTYPEGDSTMAAPSTDRAAVTAIIRTLRAAGYVLENVWDGEDFVSVATESAALEAIFAVDEATLNVTHPERRSSYVYFVLGNEPFEVACDYGVSLEETLAPLFESWDS